MTWRSTRMENSSPTMRTWNGTSGRPWYRPTRVVHATRGSEFGWRSGTGKWPTHYLDSLPPAVDIGPGSPVGVDFGYGLRFPAKYQRALYICDWTFGTMYAIHLTPDGSTYSAVKEEFVARNALPLTDVVAGTDGAMYFTVGGRGTQSELYRVTYKGNESTSPAQTQDREFAKQRRTRRKAEMPSAEEDGTGQTGNRRSTQQRRPLRSLRRHERFQQTRFFHDRCERAQIRPGSNQLPGLARPTGCGEESTGEQDRQRGSGDTGVHQL